MPAGIKLTRKNNEIRKECTYKRYTSKECQKCRHIVEWTKNEYRRTPVDKFDPILYEIKKKNTTQNTAKLHILAEAHMLNEDLEFYLNPAISEE